MSKETHPSERRRAYLISDEERSHILFVLGEWEEYKATAIDYCVTEELKEAVETGTEVIADAIRKAMRA